VKKGIEDMRCFWYSLFYIFSLTLLYIYLMDFENPLNIGNSALNKSFSHTLKTIHDNGGGLPLVVTFTNGGDMDLAKAFICNVIRLKDPILLSLLVVIVTKKSILDELTEFNTNVTVILKPFNGSKDSLEYGTTLYQDFIEYRTGTVLELLRSNVPLLLVDNDHYWLTSPLLWLPSYSNWDLIAENNQLGPEKLQICAGFLYLNNTPATKALWTKVDGQTKFFRRFSSTQHIHEQFVMSHTLRMMNSGPKTIEDPELKQRKAKKSPQMREEIDDKWRQGDQMFPLPLPVRWTFFRVNEVVSGIWYKNPSFRKRNPKVWSIHGNWLIGVSKKIKRAKDWGHWLLDDTTGLCKQ